MNLFPSSYRDFLRREFASRKSKNPHYSLRAYARDLDFLPPKLSQTLNGKCGISRKRGHVLAQRLGLSASEEEAFLLMIDSEHSRSPQQRKEAQDRLAQLKEKIQANFPEFALEKFAVIRDWYHFAILELTETKDFVGCPKWMAQQLSLKENLIEEAIERLIKLELLKKTSSSLEQTHKDLATPSEIPSRDIKEHHLQILSQAQNRLEKTTVAERDYSATTLAIDSQKIDAAKKALKEFRRQFCIDVQEGENKDRVYCLSMQFFPLDESKKEDVNSRSGEQL